MHNEPQVAAQALKAGASGYVTKDSEPEISSSPSARSHPAGLHCSELPEQMVFDALQLQMGLRTPCSRTGSSKCSACWPRARVPTRSRGQLAISNKTVSTHKSADGKNEALQHGRPDALSMQNGFLN